MKLQYAVVFQQTPNNYGAYAPDVPGCISTGKTWNEIQEMMREALTYHIEFTLEHRELHTRARAPTGTHSSFWID